MNKEDVLRRSREENAGRRDERERLAQGKAARAGMLVGAVVCGLLAFAGELLFDAPEIGLAGCLVYAAMQFAGSLALYRELKNKRDLFWGIAEIALSVAIAGLLVVRGVVQR